MEIHFELVRLSLFSLFLLVMIRILTLPHGWTTIFDEQSSTRLFNHWDFWSSSGLLLLDIYVFMSTWVTMRLLKLVLLLVSHVSHDQVLFFSIASPRLLAARSVVLLPRAMTTRWFWAIKLGVALPCWVLLSGSQVVLVFRPAISCSAWIRILNHLVFNSLPWRCIVDCVEDLGELVWTELSKHLLLLLHVKPVLTQSVLFLHLLLSQQLLSNIARTRL